MVLTDTKKICNIKRCTISKVFDYVLNKLKTTNYLNLLKFGEGKCGKCGRALTVPSSILTGIGPECSKSYQN
jgi:hypothetical protein